MPLFQAGDRMVDERDGRTEQAHVTAE
jgi:hypothetical protein